MGRRSKDQRLEQNELGKRCGECGIMKPWDRYKACRKMPHHKPYYPSQCKDCFNAYCKRRRIENPEPERERVRRWILKDPSGHIHNGLSQRARIKGIPFDLSREQVRQLLKETTVCPVFGMPLQRSTTGRMQNDSPSFDRINPSLGYTMGNVVVISWRANHLKNDATAKELRQLADWLDRIEIEP